MKSPCAVFALLALLLFVSAIESRKDSGKYWKVVVSKDQPMTEAIHGELVRHSDSQMTSHSEEKRGHAASFRANHGDLVGRPDVARPDASDAMTTYYKNVGRPDAANARTRYEPDSARATIYNYEKVGMPDVASATANYYGGVGRPDVGRPDVAYA